MTIRDGNPQPEDSQPVPQAPVTATIDPSAVAAAFAEIQRQQATQTPAPGLVQQRLAELLSQENVNKESVNDLGTLLEATRKDTEASLSQAFDAKLRDARYLTEIDSALDKYAVDDEAIADSVELLKKRMIDDMFSNPEWASLKNKYGRGEVDRASINKLAQKHVERAYKVWKREKTQEKSPDLSSSVPTGSAAAAVGITPGQAAPNPDELTPARRELYRVHKSLLLRTGVKPEEADARAFNAAQGTGSYAPQKQSANYKRLVAGGR